jgi:heat shock protein HslJ
VLSTLALALVVACGADPAASLERIAHPAGLATTSWRLVGIGERLVPADPVVSLLFTATEASGSGGCNAFGGTYAYDPATGDLRIASLVSTKRACVEGQRNEFEAAYFATLQGPLTATVDDAGRLVLIGQDATLRFEVGPQQGAPAAP